MKTIDFFIREELSQRTSEKEIARDDRIIDVYERFPKLRLIDDKIIELRRSNILKILDNEMDSSEFVNKEESKLQKERAKFIKEHLIPNDFDTLIVQCQKCNDTGFVVKNGPVNVRKVCSCMKIPLEQSYKEAGLSDYSFVEPKNLKDSEVKNQKNIRAAAKKRLDKVIEDLIVSKPQGILIYSDGTQTGKTYLSVCVAKMVINFGYGAMFIRTDSILSLSEEKIEDLKKCDFLVIDGYLGSLTRSGKTGEILDGILESRNYKNLPTIIVTSETPDETVTNSYERVASKLSTAERIK
ncbi:MAG: hypothetical protein J6U54_15685 [Clostridiales bacterium]|nr:hypothetical protein [Clostridiales bacterium]